MHRPVMLGKYCVIFPQRGLLRRPVSLLKLNTHEARTAAAAMRPVHVLPALHEKSRGW